nr:hypothetical protein CFP56_01262 [Quercus suber]
MPSLPTSILIPKILLDAVTEASMANEHVRPRLLHGVIEGTRYASAFSVQASGNKTGEAHERRCWTARETNDATCPQSVDRPVARDEWQSPSFARKSENPKRGRSLHTTICTRLLSFILFVSILNTKPSSSVVSRTRTTLYLRLAVGTADSSAIFSGVSFSCLDASKAFG